MGLKGGGRMPPIVTVALPHALTNAGHHSGRYDDSEILLALGLILYKITAYCLNIQCPVQQSVDECTNRRSHGDPDTPAAADFRSDPQHDPPYGLSAYACRDCCGVRL